MGEEPVAEPPADVNTLEDATQVNRCTVMLGLGGEKAGQR